MKWTALLWLPLLFAGCGGRPPIPREDLLLRIWLDPARDRIAPGRAFTLRVQRVWREDLVPEHFEEKALEPLVLRLLGKEQRRAGGRVEEVRRYRAWAFTLGEVAVGRIPFRARPAGGGDFLVVHSAPLRLAVVPTLDPADPGPAELPGPPLVPPRFPFAWAAAGAGLLAAVLFALYWVKRKRVPVAPPAPDPRERALSRLARLRTLAAGGEEQVLAFFTEAAAALREFLEEALTACTPQMTTADLLAAPRTAALLAPEQRDFLARFLGRCDLVKFARVGSPAAEREELLAAAESFLRRAPEAAAAAWEEGAEERRAP